MTREPFAVRVQIVNKLNVLIQHRINTLHILSASSAPPPPPTLVTVRSQEYL